MRMTSSISSLNLAKLTEVYITYDLFGSRDVVYFTWRTALERVGDVMMFSRFLVISASTATDGRLTCSFEKISSAAAPERDLDTRRKFPRLFW
jgi:hypothetical protein